MFQQSWLSWARLVTECLIAVQLLRYPFVSMRCLVFASFCLGKRDQFLQLTVCHRKRVATVVGFTGWIKNLVCYSPYQHPWWRQHHYIAFHSLGCILARTRHQLLVLQCIHSSSLISLLQLQIEQVSVWWCLQLEWMQWEQRRKRKISFELLLKNVS